MNGLLAFYNSSVGKKISMSLTGLFLCTFLVEHLVGNLLILPIFNGNDGGIAFDAYSKFMASNPLIRTTEFILFGSIILHALSGVTVWLKNRRARPQKYEVYGIADNTKFASRVMMVSASAVFIFLVIHLNTFFVKMRLTGEHFSGYGIAQEAFSHSLYSWFYIFALGLLSFHLYHGFQSAFQTLGLKTKKYAGLIDAIAIIFWLVIPIGFAVIPIYFLYIHQTIAMAQ